MEVLSSRLLLRPSDFENSVRFYRDVLGLAVYREWRGGVVLFVGGGYLEISGVAETAGAANLELWLQVRDLARTHQQLVQAGVAASPPQRKPWGMLEMAIHDPDGVRIVIVEVPEDHPLRRRADGS